MPLMLAALDPSAVDTNEPLVGSSDLIMVEVKAHYWFACLKHEPPYLPE